MYRINSRSCSRHTYVREVHTLCKGREIVCNCSGFSGTQTNITVRRELGRRASSKGLPSRRGNSVDIHPGVFFFPPTRPRFEGVSGGGKRMGATIRNFDQKCFAVRGRATWAATGAELVSLYYLIISLKNGTDTGCAGCRRVERTVYILGKPFFLPVDIQCAGCRRVGRTVYIFIY